MSWNRIVFSIWITLTIGVSLLHADNLNSVKEDKLIIKAILYDEYQSYDKAYYCYKQLFDETGAEVYLYKEVHAALMAKKYIEKSIERLKSWDKKHPNKMALYRLLIPLYLTINQIDNAKKEALFLLEHSHLPVDLDVASNAFLYAGEYKRALKMLEKVYAAVPHERTLFRMVSIMDAFTNERKKAIQMLETHRRMNRVSNDFYMVLLLMYKKEKDIDGILETYKAMYEDEKNNLYLSKIIDAYGYKKDIDGAIKFLEKEGLNEELLYQLYREKRDFVKAMDLIELLYQKDKDAKWIAEKGVLIFEKAKDKNDKKMIHKVLSQFEKAIALGNDDSVYLNYYGYTLIDEEIDIQKGIKVVKKALLQQPDNAYYLDSLAWGYYKEGQCEKAYEVMKRVVDEEGLKEKEIHKHWNSIRQCK